MNTRACLSILETRKRSALILWREKRRRNGEKASLGSVPLVTVNSNKRCLRVASLTGRQTFFADRPKTIAENWTHRLRVKSRIETTLFALASPIENFQPFVPRKRPSPLRVARVDAKSSMWIDNFRRKQFSTNRILSISSKNVVPPRLCSILSKINFSSRRRKIVEYNR